MRISHPFHKRHIFVIALLTIAMAGPAHALSRSAKIKSINLNKTYKKRPSYVPNQILIKSRRALDLYQGKIMNPKGSMKELLDKYPPSLIQKASENLPGIYKVKFNPAELNQKIDLEVQQRLYVEKSTRPSLTYLQETKLEADIKQAVQSEYTVERMSSEFAKEWDVEWAQPNYLYYAQVNGEGEPPADDPYLHDQWHLPFINALKGWETETGSPDIKICVIDSGVDYHHEDLQGNINPNAGYDFVSLTEEEILESEDITPVEGEDYGPRDADPMDKNGHGTHVAGIAAAVGNNTTGVSGAMWQADIIPVRALASVRNQEGFLDGTGTSEDIADAIKFCADPEKGIDIINASFGGTAIDPVIRDATAEAVDAGVLFVAAAGNDGLPFESYPAAYEGVLAVGALGQSGNLAPFSNFGSWVDLYAPGVNILSLRAAGTDMYEDENQIYAGDDKYYYSEGTSMASPLVAGVAGVIKSHFPGISNEDIIARLVTVAEDGGYHTGLGRHFNTEAIDLELSLKPEESNNTVHLVGVEFKDTADGNRIPEPGEQGSLVLYLKNVLSDVEINSLTGNLTADNPFIQIGNSQGVWDTLPAGDVVGNEATAFPVTVAADCPVNTQVTLEFTAVDSGGKVVSKRIPYTFNPVIESQVGPEVAKLEGKMVLENSPYEVETEAWIPEWSRLVIEPGVVIRFLNHESGLRVIGKLEAIGDVGNNIVFTSRVDEIVPDEEGFVDIDDFWGRLIFHFSPHVSELQHVTIKNGLGLSRWPNGGGILSIFSDVRLKDCRIADNVTTTGYGGGVEIHGGHSIIDGCIIENNESLTINSDTADGIFSESNSEIINNQFVNNHVREFSAFGKEIISKNSFEGNTKEISSDQFFSNTSMITVGGNALFANNIVRNNSKRKDNGWNSDILTVKSQANLINNVIADNTGTALAFLMTANDFRFKNVLIENNLIFNNRTHLTKDVIRWWGLILDKATMINNVIYGNEGHLSLTDDRVEQRDRELIFKNNIMFNNGSDFFSDLYRFPSGSVTYSNTHPKKFLISHGNINADPQFVDPENGDFRLSATSPSIDAGDPDPFFNDKDGTRNDMGHLGGSLLQTRPHRQLEFRITPLGETAMDQLVLFNHQTPGLIIESLEVPGPFALASSVALPVTLQEGEYLILDMTFTPTEAAVYELPLQVSGQTPAGEFVQAYQLRGVGTDYTLLEGRYEGDHTLTRQNSPYLVMYNGAVFDNLIIEEGVQVFFADNYEKSGIAAESITAHGLPDQVIRFEGFDGGTWGGLVAPIIDIKYAVIQDLNPMYGWSIQGKEVSLDHCTVTNSSKLLIYTCSSFDEEFPESIAFTNSIYYFNAFPYELLERQTLIDAAQFGWEICPIDLSGSDIKNVGFLTGANPGAIDDTGTINQDPLFMSRENRDYRLRDGSPALGSALDGGNMGALGQVPPPEFLRGDANNSGDVDMNDAIFTLTHLFLDGPDFACPNAADSNDDEFIDIGDPLHTLFAVFKGTVTISEPFPEKGVDPTPGNLTCESGIPPP